MTIILYALKHKIYGKWKIILLETIHHNCIFVLYPPLPTVFLSSFVHIHWECASIFSFSLSFIFFSCVLKNLSTILGTDPVPQNTDTRKPFVPPPPAPSAPVAPSAPAVPTGHHDPPSGGIYPNIGQRDPAPVNPPQPSYPNPYGNRDPMPAPGYNPARPANPDPYGNRDRDSHGTRDRDSDSIGGSLLNFLRGSGGNNRYGGSGGSSGGTNYGDIINALANRGGSSMTIIVSVFIRINSQEGLFFFNSFRWRIGRIRWGYLGYSEFVR